MKFLAFVVVFLGTVATLFVLGALFAVPTMLLVNSIFSKATILAVFGTAKLGFWQAFALNVITGILFRSSNSK